MESKSRQTFLNLGPWLTCIMALLILALTPLSAFAELTVDGYELISKVRAGRTAYDYTVRANVTNDGTESYTAVSASLTSLVPTTIVIDGALDFGDVLAGATVASSDTFTVRINRLYPFNESDLSWEVVGGVVTDTTPPTISLTSPADGDTLSGTVNITANASDNVGVERVEFRVDGSTLSTDTTAPYEHSLDTTTLSAGIHSLAAIAYDAAGNGASASINITVFNDTTPPTISLTAPADGDTLSGTVNITADASDNVGVERVEFRVDGSTLSTDTTAPYEHSLDTTTLSDGIHSIGAIAYDAAGNGASSSINVTVLNDTTPPTISLTNPADGDTLSGTVNITATASDNVGVERVEFRLDGSTLSSDTTSPYAHSLDTTTLSAGGHTLTAIAYDAAGNSASTSISVTVISDTTLPTVSSTNPLHRARGALLTGPVTATFSEAIDPATVNVNSFVVTDSAGVVSGTVSLSSNGLTASFTPTTPFSYSTRYDIQLTTEISDVSGNQLATDHTWFFNTGKRLAGSYAHTCARLDDGGLKCWGVNNFGQLGLGNTNYHGDDPSEMGSNLPRVNLGTDRKVVQVVTGGSHTCARLDNGSVKCWGYNAFGQLGLGDTIAHGDHPGEMGDDLPAVNLGAIRTALELVAGYDHTCARLDNNNVKCWGRNDTGMLGLGDTNSRGFFPGQMGGNLPRVDLGTGRRARQLSAGDVHTCARLDNGSVKCWGANTFGNLGLGDTASRGDAPNEMGDDLPAVDLGIGRTVLGIAANGQHSCVRLDNNNVKCWGRNGNAGRLGLGDTDNRGDTAGEMGDNLPAVELGTGRTAQGLAVGSLHSCARLDDETLKCWGRNAWGALGLGDTDNRGDAAGEMGDNLPAVELGTGRTVKEIVAANHNCARLDDSSVKCWGYNRFGQLGLGDTDNRGDEPGEMGDNLPAVDIGN